MRLYKLQYAKKHGHVSTEWFSSKHAARAAHKKIQPLEDNGQAQIYGIYPVSFTATRTGIIEFLNSQTR